MYIPTEFAGRQSKLSTEEIKALLLESGTISIIYYTHEMQKIKDLLHEASDYIDIVPSSAEGLMVGTLWYGNAIGDHFILSTKCSCEEVYMDLFYSLKRRLWKHILYNETNNN